MAKPNKTVASFRRKHPNVAAEEATRQRMSAPSPMKDIMDKVQSGEMTVAEGVEAIYKNNKIN